MPFFLKKYKTGYKVYSINPKTRRKKYYSNHPLTLKQAIKQLTALRMNTGH